MRKLAALLALVCLVFPAFGAARKAPTSKKSPASTAPAKKPTSKTTAVSSKKKKSSQRVVRRRPRQTWRTGQMQPAPERYVEIQQALNDRGYGAGAADGKWNLQWTAGLKRFQQDQSLEPSGKITALSLLALGLGPKREATAGTIPEPQTREPQ